MTDQPEKPQFKLNLNREAAAGLQERIREQALAHLWRTKHFYKAFLDPTQLEMVEFYHKNKVKNRKTFFLCSRRLGKSVVLCTLAVAEAMATPNRRILYLSKTNDNVAEIIDQTMAVILQDCPEELRPELKVKYSKYVFPNGSEIRFKGLDKAGPDSIRGVKAQLVIFDEACFMDRLGQCLRSIVMPMVINEGGHVLLASSSPSTPGHESIAIIQECEFEGGLVRKTIYDCPRWTSAHIEDFAREAGGLESSTFKREYLAHIITDDERAVLPACTDDHMKKVVVQKVVPAKDCGWYPDRYVSMDIGFRDFTFILFGYWDYPNARLCIEHEVVLRKNIGDTETIKNAIEQGQRQIWGRADFSIFKPELISYVCDVDLRFIADMNKLSNDTIRFKPTRKDNKKAQVNQTNLMIKRGELVIDPSCVNLIAHCKYALWNKQFTEFERTEAFAHFDGVDALVYMVRNVKRNREPTVDVNPHDSYKFPNNHFPETPAGDLAGLTRALGGK